MEARINLILDNIIFSLQTSGGISVVWYELLKRFIKDNSIYLSVLEYPNNNIFRESIQIPEFNIYRYNSILPIQIERYNTVNLPRKKSIFHSSYYRISPKNVNITTVHDFTYEYYKKGLPKIIHQWQKGTAIKNSQRIICVSENTKQDLLKFYPKIKEEHIKVIYNGVDSVYKPLTSKKLPFDLIPFSCEEYVLYIGDRKSLYKNFLISVEACALANLPLVIVGGGLLSPKESQLLEDSLGTNKYKHLSGITNELLNVIYNNALCLLYPSLYEGFGIPVIEAQSAGCPVITTSYSSIPEVAGDAAILLQDISKYTISEALKTVSNGALLKSELKEKGLTNAQRFSWDKCANETIKLYAEVESEYL